MILKWSNRVKDCRATEWSCKIILLSNPGSQGVDFDFAMKRCREFVEIVY